MQAPLYRLLVVLASAHAHAQVSQEVPVVVKVFAHHGAGVQVAEGGRLLPVPVQMFSNRPCFLRIS